MRDAYLKLRGRMLADGWWPQGWIARGACYSLAFAIGLFALEMLLKLFAPAWADSLGGWVKFLLFDAALLFFIVAFRKLRRRVLWRLRNRLIVTYVFIGVIPAVLLIGMAFITIYGLAGQFAIFEVTSEINSQLRSMEAVNAAVGNELAARLERGESPTAESLTGLRKRDAAWRRRRVSVWFEDKLLPLNDAESNGAPLALPTFVKGGFRDITRDQDGLHLRVGTVLPVGSKTLTVVTGEPFGKELVGRIAADMGEITLLDDSGFLAAHGSGSPRRITVNTAGKSGTVITESRNGTNVDLSPTFTVGTVPAAAGSMDREVTFFAPLPVLDWRTGEHEPTGSLVVQVRTRPSVLYGHLFAALGEFVRGVEYILLAILIIFAVIEFVALIIGTRMTRTVTRAVADLYDATKHVDRGDFSHRIPVKSEDQLAQLSLSFNSMTESIEKLIEEQKEKQRLEGELAIAQEVQAQLFPRQVTELESLEVHGFCRPARTVSGDYYDFLTASSHKLILAVGDISGKGISAALLMATIHSAVRAYSVESLPQMREPVAVGAVAGAGRIMAAWPEGIEVSPGALLGLLNHQLYESTPPEKYATLFLGIYDGRSHQLTYSNGGHLPPILIGRDGTVRRLEAGGTVVGLFDNMLYDEGAVEMHPGEIFLAYSDGVTEPENEFGEFGEERLIELVSANRRLPLVQISQTVTAAVDDWIGDNEQPDDITLVLARAR
ncbi:MAG: SpoIIE family protein phosphatase [Candidatus Sulfotelmatobacter sp.]|jgi:phosphoserine phosphatase RsbU/P